MKKNDLLGNSAAIIVSIHCQILPPMHFQTNCSTLKDHRSPQGSLDNLGAVERSSSPCDDCLLSTMPELKTITSAYVPTKTDTTGLDEMSKKCSGSSDFGENYAKWRKLTLVAKSIQRFRAPRVERIKSETNLRKSIISTECSQLNSNNAKGIMFVTPQQMHNDALGTFRDQTAFFEALEIASKRDLLNIRRTLSSDPKENLYDPESPQRLANKPNFRGYTPLYVACKNGNLELIKLLFDYKANPYQLCKVSSKEKESILLAAARWGHLDVVKYLLNEEKFVWPERELKKACQEAGNGQIKKIIKSAIARNKRPLLERLFSCSQQRKINYFG